MSVSTLIDQETGEIYSRFIPSNITELGAANTVRKMDSTGDEAEWSKITVDNISSIGATQGYVLTASAGNNVIFAPTQGGTGEINVINTDDTSIVPENNEISILGSGNILTDGTAASVLTISLQNIDAGAVLIGGQTNTIENIGASTPGKFLQVDGDTEWTESNIQLPQNTTANCVLFSLDNNEISETNTLGDAVLITDENGVPEFSLTLPAVDGASLTNINAVTFTSTDDDSPGDYFPIVSTTNAIGGFPTIAISTTGPRSSCTMHSLTGEIRQATDLTTEITFNRQVSGHVSSRLYHDGNNITLQCLQLQESTVAGKLIFGCPTVSGSNIDGYQFLDEGIVVGDSVIGDNCGIGTINISSDYYINGTSITNADYVCELYCHGKIEKTKNRPGANSYFLKSIEETEQIMKQTLKLPGMFNDNDKVGLGNFTSLLLEKIEECTIHIFELNKKIKALQHEVQTNCKKIK